MRETLVKSEEFKDSPLGKIPTGWQVGRLSNFYAVPARNGLYKSAQYYGRGVLMIHMPQMFRGLEIDISDAARVDVNPTELERFELKPGDLVFARRSLNLEGAGRCSLVPELPESVTFESSIIRVRLSGEQLRPAFANYFLNSEIGFRLRLPLIRQVAVSGVSSEDIASIPILVPPIREQERIIEIIGTVDEAIAHTSSLIAKLKQMKAGLLHDLLTRGLDENGELRDAIGHPEQFKDSPLGQVPKDWEVVPIQQAAAQVPGATTIGPFGSNLLASDYRSVGVPVTFVRDIKADGFQWNSNIYVEPKKARELSAHSVQSGDLLATKMGLPPCIACVYPEWMALGIITADIIRLRPNTQISTSQWLSLFINSNAIIRQVRGITGGITRDKITLHDFRRLLIALPSLKEQKQITNILDTYNSRICCEEAYREKLKFQKQGLMHDLLTGKVRVKNA